MSFQKDNKWDGYFVKKVFSDENGVFFKDGAKWAAYYGSRFLGYFNSERLAEKAFFEAKGTTAGIMRRY